MKLNEAFRSVQRRLGAVTDEARTETDILFRELAGVSRAEAVFSEAEMAPEALAAVEGAVARRLSREPLQYILGRWSFMGLEFIVEPCALIPRQDTETLCEEAIRLIRERGYRNMLDVCTGTGCIAVSLAKLTGIHAEASDISSACAELALKNARLNNVPLAVRTADLFDGAGKYDLITANPPYISEADMNTLQPEVRFEPALALAGGADGLDFYRRIAAEAREHLNPGGALLLEVGEGQAEKAAGMFGQRTGIVTDLNGIERVVITEN